MNINVYTVSWNEEVFMPYFLRHYSAFAARIVVYDNHSTDRTPEVVGSCPRAELRTYDSRNFMNEHILKFIKSNAWKEDRGADWVVCCDVDELLYHPDLVGYLAGCKRGGVTIPVPRGFDMVADRPPSGDGQAWEEIRTGRASQRDCGKWMVFDPSRIRDINYCIGCHNARPTGDVHLLDPSELKNLHYHKLGVDYMAGRYAARRERVIAGAGQLDWAQYRQDRDEIRKIMKDSIINSINVVDE